VKPHSIEALAHHALTETESGELRRLFDSKCLEDHGEWDPEQPCGYRIRPVAE